MFNINITAILTNLDFYNLIPGITSLDYTLGKLGMFQERVDHNFFFDLYWDNVCVTFDKQNNLIEKIDILFDEQTKYKGYEIHPLQGKITFQQKLSLEKLFMFLNYQNVNYSVRNSGNDNEYLFIIVNDIIRITYYLPWRHLTKITLSGKNVSH